MAQQTTRLKVEGLDSRITEDKLRTVFRNPRSKGGGAVEHVELHEDSTGHWAIITFQKNDAVDRIIERGNKVEVEHVLATVTPIFDRKKSKDGKKAKKERRSQEGQDDSSGPLVSQDSEQEENCEASTKQKECRSSSEQSKKKGQGTHDQKNDKRAKKKKQAAAHTSDLQEKSEEEYEDDYVFRTIKATIIDVSKSKEFYELYFEDPTISPGPIDETSMMLDGLNRWLYVTFEHREDAKAFCQLKHDADSNISKVQMASSKDFDTYCNLMSVHGYNIETDEGKYKLVDFVCERTNLDIDDIIQDEEPKSAVVVFSPDTCEDITTAIWSCASSLAGIRLITAPVYKTFTVRVQSLDKPIDVPYCKRYLTITKRSGGGNITSFEEIGPNEAIVTFGDEEGFEGVIQKSDHTLGEDARLSITPYYPCLSERIYQECVAMEKRSQSRRAGAKGKTDGSPAQPVTSSPVARLKCVQYPLYHSPEIFCSSRKIHGALTLSKFGYQYLKTKSGDLERVVRGTSCTYDLDLQKNENGTLKLFIHWPQKIPASEVKEKLNKCLETVKTYLDKYLCMDFAIKEANMHAFQCYWGNKRQTYSVIDQIFFHHATNSAVVISNCDSEEVEDAMNLIYQSFVSENSQLGHVDTDGSIANRAHGQRERKNTGEANRRRGGHNWFGAKGGKHGPAHPDRNPFSSSDGYRAKQSPSTINTRRNSTGGRGYQHGQESGVAEPDVQGEEEEEEDKMYIIPTEQTFEKRNLVLFQKTHFKEQVEKEENVKIIIKIEQSLAVIKSMDKEHGLSACVKLLKKSKDDFKSQKITNLSHEQIEFLKTTSTEKNIDNRFEEYKFPAFMECTGTDNSVTVHYSQPAEPTKLEEIVRLQAGQFQKPLTPEMMLIFRSDPGQRFLASLESSDGFQVNCSIKIHPDQKSLLIVSPVLHQDSVHAAIQKFVQDNEPHEKEIPFSKGKQAFVDRFMKGKVDEISRNLEPLGTTISIAPNKFVIKGLKDGVKLGEGKLAELRDSILAQDHVLKYFGIEEFLSQKEGQDLCKNIEKDNTCVIISKAEAGVDQGKTTPGKPSKPVVVPPPRQIASVIVNSCSIWFLQGDITGLTTDVIVHPLDSSLSWHGGLDKALIAAGGPGIQHELSTANLSRSVGSIAQTSAGQLKTCKAIFHLVCPKFDPDEENESLVQAVVDCLDYALTKGFTSIGFPALGIGRTFKFPQVAAFTQLLQGIKMHILGKNTNLTDIYLCDVRKENVEELMDRSDNIFEDCEKTVLGQLRETESRAPRDSSRFSPPAAAQTPIMQAIPKRKNFKHIKVKVVAGEITNQQVDVIVISVDKSLDLSKGQIAKAVLTSAGDDVQDELFDNYRNGIKSGEFATSSGGNLNCQHIFHACLSRWNGHKSYLGSLVMKLLEEMEKLQMSRIAIPALGTGKLGYPADLAAQEITDAISHFAENNAKSSLKSVDLVVYPKDREVMQAFKAAVSGVEGGAAAEHDDRSSEGKSWYNQARSAVRSVKQFFTGSSTNFTFGSVTLHVKKGNILEEKCDAVVMSVKENMNLASSGAVGKAALKQCGDALQTECNDKVDEMAQFGVVSTASHGLKCSHIYHISMDKFSRKWDAGLAHLLKTAEDQGIQSIALPALGAGAKRADIGHVKQTIFKAVSKFGTSDRRKLKDIHLVLYSQEMLDEFIGEEQKSEGRSHSNEGHSLPPIQSKVSTQAVLKIYAKRPEDISKASFALDKACKSGFKETKDKIKVKSLSKKQVRELEEAGQKYCVKVTVRHEEGVVLMHSFSVIGVLHVQKKLSDIRAEAIDSHHKAMQQSIKSAIQWQFKQGHKWRDFDPSLNMELEVHYKQNAANHIITDPRGRQYSVDFASMKEVLVDANGKQRGDAFDVRRYDLTKEGEPLPSRWDHMADTENLKIVPVKSGSPEYKKVEQNFVKGGANLPIKKIERIQNKSLYQQYSVKKREMEFRNPKGHQNERTLFHGTSASTVQFINEAGFNRSYCGKNATAYGDGVYFAVNSSYSVGYANPDPLGNKMMYQARVLVGESTRSSSGMKHLPNKPGTNLPYDSGTDGSNVMYIIFHDAQTYPEYLITF